MRVVFLFICFTFNVFIKTFALSANKINIYTDSKEIGSMAFLFAEVISSELNISVNIMFEEPEKIKEKMLSGNDPSFALTENYQFLNESSNQNLNITEAFFDKLIYLNTEYSKEKEEAIFFKTSSKDKEIIDIESRQIPSILIESRDFCNEISSLFMNYQNRYKHIIIKESIAVKCHISYFGSFDSLYNLYYFVGIEKENSNLENQVIDFIKNSSKIKNAIRQNGYHI